MPGKCPMCEKVWIYAMPGNLCPPCGEQLEEMEDEKEGIMSEWTPVSEVLPEEMEDVLVIEDCGTQTVGRLWDDGTWRDHCWSSNVLEPTHWQPLPAPPKEAP